MPRAVRLTANENPVAPPVAPVVQWCGDPLPPGLSDISLLGHKGVMLLRAYQAGLRVPPFFIITTAAAQHPVPSAGLEIEVQGDIRRALAHLERETGRSFGDERNPLLLAVRCSSADPTAGLLASIMNVGMSPRIAQTILARSADDRFVFDCYRRLIMQFARVVHDVDPILFDRDLRAELDNRGLESEVELDGAAMREISRRFQGIYSMRVGSEFPNEPLTQFSRAVLAAIRSGEHPRLLAILKRQEPLPVAVVVQAMVFGNRATESCSGVATTRNPITGANEIVGEYLPASQGSDIVGGRHHPLPFSRLAEENPAAFGQFDSLKHSLESHFHDAQEFEFTVEMGTPYLLRCRSAACSGEAATRIAVDMADARIISRSRAVARIAPESLDRMLHARFELDDHIQPLATGFAASPGAAVGRLSFSSADATERSAKGEKVILVRRETDASDVIGMHHCEGILTSTGGMTSHAAVVARGMGKPCVAGAVELQIEETGKLVIGNRRLGAKDVLSVDGTAGMVYPGEVRRVEGELSPSLLTLLYWADEIRTLEIYANADTPADAALAIKLGARGIGLCRTEHMFFAPRRIMLMRKMILAGKDDLATRRAALAALLPYQRQDFVQMFATMAGRPVIIRLLDPPLHEFLPHGSEDQKDLARELGLTQREVRRRIEQLEETNPMLGHRGCRLAISFPEILEMQVQAIVEAAAECAARGIDITPGIMIPLTIDAEEMRLMRERVRATADRTMREAGVLVRYEVGTMIETPRAALLAGAIAQHADFFSIGTNDLTQATLVISRDDAGKFMPDYQRSRLLDKDPFRTIDQDGVGELIRLAITRGRETKPVLSCGICGEHAGDPASIGFFADCGVNYISCSPLRLPIARLAAAQAQLIAEGEES